MAISAYFNSTATSWTLHSSRLWPLRRVQSTVGVSVLRGTESGLRGMGSGRVFRASATSGVMISLRMRARQRSVGTRRWPRRLLSCCKYSTSRPETQGVLALVGTRIDRHREALPAKSGRQLRSEVRRTIGRDSSLHAQCVVADESYREGEQADVADVSDRARIPTASSNTSALLSARRTDCAGAQICLGCAGGRWSYQPLPAGSAGGPRSPAGPARTVLRFSTFFLLFDQK